MGTQHSGSVFSKNLGGPGIEPQAVKGKGKTNIYSDSKQSQAFTDSIATQEKLTTKERRMGGTMSKYNSLSCFTYPDSKSRGLQSG